jgi:hypothetical protein
LTRNPVSWDLKRQKPTTEAACIHTDIKGGPAPTDTLNKFYSTLNKQPKTDLEAKFEKVNKVVTNPYTLFYQQKFPKAVEQNPGKYVFLQVFFLIFNKFNLVKNK